jgi:hypothetical protein
MTLDDIRSSVQDIRNACTDIRDDLRSPFRNGNLETTVAAIVQQIDALAVLLLQTTQNTSGQETAGSERPRDPRINPVPGDRISRTVREIKTIRFVIALKTGPEGTVTEVTFEQIGPAGRRIKAHGIYNWIDWARKADIEPPE